MTHQAKEIVFEAEARNYLKNGIEKLSKAVAFTIGPCGRNVGIEALYGTPKITSSGNEIAEAITLNDKYEDLGASLAKKTAEDVRNAVSDGTTTSLLLLSKIVEESIKYIAAGASPILIKRGLEKGEKALLEALQKGALQVKTVKEAYPIAKASALGEEQVASLIGEALEKVGLHGVALVQESKGVETFVESVEGVEFDKGYLSPYFCTNPEKMIAELQNPFILIVDQKLNTIHDLLPLLEQVATTQKELLIIAEDLETDLLSTLVINKLKGVLKVTAVKAPGFGDNRKALLKDLAVITGSTVISDEAHSSLKELGVQALGMAEKVIISKDKTVIINGSGNKEGINLHVKALEGEIERSSSSYEKEKLLERKGKLKGGVAIIRVGDLSESGLKEKKRIIEDALKSTKAALSEGIVIGGGLALVQAGKEALTPLLTSKELTAGEVFGVQALMKAVFAPSLQILENGGYHGEVILSDLEKRGKSIGFNVMTGKEEDFLEGYLVDPLKVVKTALSYALSTAKTVILSEALIVDADEV